MKSSVSSSAKPSNPSPGRETHKAFALTGRSRALDPLSHAVRGDLADIRLADQVFAPHYAAPMPVVVKVAATLRAAAAEGSDTLAELASGDVFEALEFAGSHAWGVAPGRNLVGYLPLAALGRTPA